MQQKDIERFKALLIGTAGALGQYLPPESIPVWFSDLIRYDIQDIESAFEAFRKDPNGQKMPTAGQVIYLIKSKNKKPLPLEQSEKIPPPEGFFDKVFDELEKTRDLHKPIYFKKYDDMAGYEPEPKPIQSAGDIIEKERSE